MLPVGVRWGVGGAIAQKFAQEGFFTVLTTRNEANAAALAAGHPRAGRRLHDRRAGPRLAGFDRERPSPRSAAKPAIRRCWSTMPAISKAATCRPTRSCSNTSRSRCSTPGCTSPARGPFLVAKEVLPAMRKNGQGSFFFSNNSSSLRGKKRMTGQSLYYPRVMMRTLAQVLTEEYSEHGVHVANIVIDGTHQLARQPGIAAQPEPHRPDHQSGQDRRGVLVPAHPGPLVLDARDPADPVRGQAELLTKSFNAEVAEEAQRPQGGSDPFASSAKPLRPPR